MPYFVFGTVIGLYSALSVQAQVVQMLHIGNKVTPGPACHRQLSIRHPAVFQEPTDSFWKHCFLFQLFRGLSPVLNWL